MESTCGNASARRVTKRVFYGELTWLYVRSVYHAGSELSRREWHWSSWLRDAHALPAAFGSLSGGRRHCCDRFCCPVGASAGQPVGTGPRQSRAAVPYHCRLPRETLPPTRRNAQACTVNGVSAGASRSLCADQTFPRVLHRLSKNKAHVRSPRASCLPLYRQFLS